MDKRLTALALAAVVGMAACGGGNTSSTPSVPSSNPAPSSAPTTAPTSAPTTHPTSAPTSAPTVAPTVAPTTAPTAAPVQGDIPTQAMVAGSIAWVDPATKHTLYWLDVDTPTGGTCVSAACLALWPIDKPAAGSKANGTITIITRSDGMGQQWALNGHPLYFYSGDSGPQQANGDNFPEFGGHWHVARPNGTATPPPGQTPAPCTGPYC